jgi:PEGA domain
VTPSTSKSSKMFRSKAWSSFPKGGVAFATVTEAQAKRRMARRGKLDINIDYAKLVDSERAPLRAVKEVKGGGHTGAMTGGMVATSLVFFPAAPFFLFMHGKDISIPKGTEVTAYVSGEMKLGMAKFQSAPSPPSTSPVTSGSSAPAPAPASNASPPAPTSNEQAHLQVSSTPDGADIEIDGSFVGNTPSTIGVAAGQHRITVKKSGCNPWERTIAISSGQVSVNATLESTK